MRQIRPLPLLGMAALGLSLSACGVGPTALMVWANQTNFGHIGTSVVCLGATEDTRVDADGAFHIAGTVIDETESELDVGNLDACWGAPARVLTLEDKAGVRWKVGYRWQSSSLGNITPEILVTPGEEIEVLYRPGAVPGAAGFAVHHASDGLLYAMESGRGSAGLAPNDIPEMQVERGQVLGVEDLSCGEIQAESIVFVSATGDQAELGPGEDTPMEVEDSEGTSTLTLCNINAIEVPASCEDAAETQSEHSWVLFNPR